MVITIKIKRPKTNELKFVLIIFLFTIQGIVLVVHALFAVQIRIFFYVKHWQKNG